MSILLGNHPTDVPVSFASLIRQHLAARPNLSTGAGPYSPWPFPSTLAGRHLHPNTVMDRLRDLGVNLLGARNRGHLHKFLTDPGRTRQRCAKLRS